MQLRWTVIHHLAKFWVVFFLGSKHLGLISEPQEGWRHLATLLADRRSRVGTAVLLALSAQCIDSNLHLSCSAQTLPIGLKPSILICLLEMGFNFYGDKIKFTNICYPRWFWYPEPSCIRRRLSKVLRIAGFCGFQPGFLVRFKSRIPRLTHLLLRSSVTWISCPQYVKISNWPYVRRNRMPQSRKTSGKIFDAYVLTYRTNDAVNSE